MLIETMIRNYLASNLDVECYLEKEENMPQSYVLIERTGGGITNRIKRATVVVQSYANSMVQSAKLNEMVVELMTSMPETQNIGSCTLNADYNYTDQNTKKYRYQAVFDIYY